MQCSSKASFTILGRVIFRSTYAFLTPPAVFGLGLLALNLANISKNVKAAGGFPRSAAWSVGCSVWEPTVKGRRGGALEERDQGRRAAPQERCTTGEGRPDCMGCDDRPLWRLARRLFHSLFCARSAIQFRIAFGRRP